ncbi:MAG: peptide deformylase [Alphaproteobacteria bacterium]|nr:peptide deformylase [Alphaproteobacteria bacterium]MDH5558093.1 peptide deformylase [Alphaproteobacteria bacterium]
MAILKIARMGHPVLRQVAEPVQDPTAAQVHGLIRNMIDTMRDADGAGLAAPQVHVPLRLVIFHVPAERAGESEESAPTPLTVLINPEIEPLTEEKKLGWEGCLSVPGLMGAVPRFTKIRYSGFAPDGSRIERVAEDFHARVVQHECDHLDGILYPQRMTDLSLLIFQEEMRHGTPDAMREPTEDESEPV